MVRDVIGHLPTITFGDRPPSHTRSDACSLEELRVQPDARCAAVTTVLLIVVGVTILGRGVAGI